MFGSPEGYGGQDGEDLQAATTLAFREGGLWADCLEEQHGWRAVTEHSYG